MPIRKLLVLIAVGVSVGAISTTATADLTSARTIQVLAIGDSLPYGRADCGDCATFIDLFGHALGRRISVGVVVRNLSERTGIDSTDLRRQLSSNTTLRRAIARADAITVTIGHNDTPWNSYTDSCDGRGGYPKPDWSKYDRVCLKGSVARYGTNLAVILRQIRILRGGDPTLLRVTNDYDDLIGDPQVPRSAYPTAKRFVDAYARRTCRVATQYKAVCIDTYHAFNGSDGTHDAGALLASDHTHPNARGHRLIAALLIRAGFRPLAP